MIKIIKYYKGKALVFLILSILLTIIGTAFEIVQPIFLTSIISIVQIIGNHTGNTTLFFGVVVTITNAWTWFWILISFMAIAATISLFFISLSAFIGSRSSLLFAETIRKEAYSNILTFSFSQIDNFSTASLITRLSNDVSQIQFSFQMILTYLIRVPIMLIGGIFVAFFLNVYMGVLIIVLMSIMSLILMCTVVKIVPLFESNRVFTDDLSGVVRENILGMREVKSFNLQSSQSERYAFYNRRLTSVSYKSQIWLAPLWILVQFVMNFGTVLILILSSFLLTKPNIPPNFIADIYGLVQIMVMVLMSCIVAMMVSTLVIRSLACCRRLSEVLGTKTTITNIKNPKSFNKKNYTLEFSNVSFKYDESATYDAIENISFQLKPGQTLGIIGPTGSGKSTIINLIPRLYDIQKGEIKIGGINIKELEIKQIRENIAIALQEQIIFSGDIKYNLEYGKANASKKEMVEATKNACAYEFISNLPEKFNARVEQRGKNFSGGQKQRISLARAFIKKPKILILDNTTSALDLITEAKVQKNLGKNYKDCSKIIVSQRISSIKHANKILVIDEGKIVGSGSHIELIKNNVMYKSIVKSQLGASDE